MNKSLRILIISQYFWPENFRINDLVVELKSKGHELTILTGKPNYPKGEVFPEYLESPKAFQEYNEITVLRAPMMARGTGGIRLLLNYFTFFIGATIFGVFKLRKQKYDVIFVFEPSPVTVGIPAVVLKKIKKAPIVFWTLDLWPETLSAVGVIKSKPVLRTIGRLVSYIYNNCDLILGQSKGFESEINKYCSLKNKFRYFPNWTESIFEQTLVDIAPEIPVEKDIFNIVFTGNIGKSQDFASILDAAEKIPKHLGVRWYIVGDGRMSEWVNNEIHKRSLEDRFFLLGRFPLERMPSFYNAASALLVTLKSEPVFALTIPGKVQSYMSAGKPILTMLDGEGSELIRESDAGLTAPSGDSKLLKTNIIKMLSMEKTDLIKMGENGITFSKREFSKKKLVDQLEDWFFEVSS